MHDNCGSNWLIVFSMTLLKNWVRFPLSAPDYAPIVQGIEYSPPKRRVAGSNPAWRAIIAVFFINFGENK